MGPDEGGVHAPKMKGTQFKIRKLHVDQGIHLHLVVSLLSLKCTQLNQHGLAEPNSRVVDHFDHLFSPSLLLHVGLDGA